MTSELRIKFYKFNERYKEIPSFSKIKIVAQQLLFLQNETLGTETGVECTCNNTELLALQNSNPNVALNSNAVEVTSITSTASSINVNGSDEVEERNHGEDATKLRDEVRLAMGQIGIPECKCSNGDEKLQTLSDKMEKVIRVAERHNASITRLLRMNDQLRKQNKKKESNNE